MTGKLECPSQTRMEAFFLEGRGAEVLEHHVESCPDCRARLSSMAQERHDFLANHPFEQLWRGIQSKERTPFIARLGRWLRPAHPLRASLVMAGLASLMVFVLWRAPELPIIRSKGGVELTLYYATPLSGQETTLGKDGISLPPGADLQFVYSNPDKPFLLLLGVEADHTLSVYFSQDGTASGPVEIGSKKKLPHAIRWQPKTSYERFYALFSKEPIAVDEIRQVLDRVLGNGKSVEQTPRLPVSYTQSSILVRRNSGK